MLLLFSPPNINIGRDWGENYVFCAIFEEVLFVVHTLAPNTAFCVSFLVRLTCEIHTSLKRSLQIVSEFSFDLDLEAGRIHKFHEMLVTNDQHKIYPCFCNNNKQHRIIKKFQEINVKIFCKIINQEIQCLERLCSINWFYGSNILLESKETRNII